MPTSIRPLPERSRNPHGLAGGVVLAVLLLGALPAFGDNGRIEINNTCATIGGCLTGDLPGFPVVIGESGSYVLTGNLVVPGTNQDGLSITVSNVTVDLNGFSIIATGSTSTSANGIQAFNVANVEVRDGTIEGFAGRGILISGTSESARILRVRTRGNGFQGVDLDGTGHLISGCTSNSNSLWGFTIDGDGLIENSVAVGNTGPGMILSATVGYRDMVVSGNNGGNLNQQIGTPIPIDLGGNLCGGDAVCP